MIASPKNFIEQFQNFIEHIAGVMNGLVSSKKAQTFTEAEKKQARDNIGASRITVDSALSATSENPVQNKVINSALDGINSTLTGINAALDGQLSTRGGIVAGNIALNGNLLGILKADKKGSLAITGGNTLSSGGAGSAILWLGGGDDSSGFNGPGQFSLQASKGTWGQSGFSSHALWGTPDGSLAWSGTFSATTLKATSDKRKKTNITKTSIDLSSLSAYRYKFKEPSEVDKGFHVGLIAQEVEKILPEAVSKDEKGFLTLDYNAVVAVLVDEVNQLKSEIKQLKAKLS